MKFTVYNVATGEIARSGFCDEASLPLQAGDGEAVLAGVALDDTRYRIVDGQPVAREEDAAAVERALLSTIDRSAETVRALFVTNTESQAGVYLAKESEARALTDDPGLAESRTPHLTLEAARLGASRAELAAAILAKAAEWRAISAVIEDIRLGAKEAVRAAPTAAAKRQALAALDWTPVTGGEA